MWLITTFGYFSIVQKHSDKQAGTLTIRARIRRDLETLKQRYLPNLGPIDDSSGADYPYRAKASRDDVAQAFAKAVLDVQYSNFKAEIACQQGLKRERICSEVWLTMRKLGELDGKARPVPQVPKVHTAAPREAR